MIGVFLKNFKEYMFYSQVMVNGIHCNSLRWIYAFSFENSKINLVLVSNIALKCLNAFSYTNKEANSKEKGNIVKTKTRIKR